ncbi:Glycoside hydrolase family 18 [anaerobic digester metagenome]|jgi:spore germination protein|uniref:Glycoside hydrolase family 18 n=1 Tax=anaerobic digester metagenome TaxID=1263854 RepID=A0A485M659_9ZZZZ
MSRCKDKYERSKGKYKNVLLVLFIMLLVLTSGCQRVPEPVPESLAEQAALYSPVAGAFYVNGRGAGASYGSFYSNRDLIHEVSPLWYYVREDGSLKEDVDGEALKLASDSGVKVIPLVAFLSNASSFVLKGVNAREAAIAGIARVVREHGYDGVNIDFEIVKAAGRDYQAEREGLNRFAEGLRRELDSSGKRLDICVLPPEQPPAHLAQIYDLAVLSELADRLVVMTYDYSHSGTKPGPVAPLPWVEANIKAVLQLGISPEKISLGIASYGYDWPSGATRADVVSAREVMQSIGQSVFAAEWDGPSQTPFVVYRDSRGRDREIWFENSAASEQKMELIKKYRLAGFYLWRLGYEDALFWQTVKESLLQ